MTLFASSLPPPPPPIAYIKAEKARVADETIAKLKLERDIAGTESSSSAVSATLAAHGDLLARETSEQDTKDAIRLARQQADDQRNGQAAMRDVNETKSHYTDLIEFEKMRKTRANV